MTTAMTNRTWMNPPMVELVTSPNNQSIMRTTAIVYNIIFPFILIHKHGHRGFSASDGRGTPSHKVHLIAIFRFRTGLGME
jgi:hypothetical protein